MKVLETERLNVRWATTDDAAFIFRLVNEPSWLEYIGDRNIGTLEDAENYIKNSMMKMYSAHGFGLYLVELKESGDSIGICGLIKRDELEDVDLGFAFLPEYWHKGYAAESARAVMAYGKEHHNLSRLVAITIAANQASITLLKRLGFRSEGTIRLKDDADELEFYAVEV